MSGLIDRSLFLPLLPAPSDSDHELLGSMAARLAKVEKQLLTATAEILQKVDIYHHSHFTPSHYHTSLPHTSYPHTSHHYNYRIVDIFRPAKVFFFRSVTSRNENWTHVCFFRQNGRR